MKRIYNFITKANQVLLFFVIIGGATLIAYTIYQSRRPYEPPHVSIAQTSEEAKKSIVNDVRFLGQSSGLFVFGIVKHIVTPTEEPGRFALALPSASLGSADFRSGEMVNVVFSKGEQRVRTLLRNDGLVLSNNMSDDRRSEKIKALLFLCVTEDTDGNSRLDEADRNDLYVIAEDLGKPDLVVKGVESFQVLSLTHLAVKTGESNAIQFWDVDTETQEKKEIVWK